MSAFAAWAEGPVAVLEGKNVGSGEPCTLVIESWGFEEGQPEEWWAVQASVRSNYQFEANPAISVKRSHTPWSLYGQTKENYDQIAITLDAGVPATPSAIRNYVFQTWDEDRKLVQKSCRFPKS